MASRSKTPSKVLLLFILVTSLPTLFIITFASSTDSFVFGGCTQQKFVPNSPYEYNLDSLLTSLVNSATYSSYNNFTILGSSPQDVVYGLYQCRGDLSMPDCATCVARAVSHLGNLCSATCGGALQLMGCYVKYDNATFLGVEDKTVVLKKCGPSEGYDNDAMGRRDAVFAGMLGTGGLYRVGGSGEIQGLAQCVGDLSFGECQDCLSTAIGRLKTDCGMGVYGDMYLGKCYARYSIGKSGGGGGGGGSGNGSGGFFSTSHGGKSGNGGEKTFAIIIGLLAGVALLIIFLAFLRKVFGGNGK